MRPVSLLTGTAVLSCWLLAGCGAENSAGPGAASSEAAKDQNAGQDAMEKMKNMQKAGEIPNPGSAGPAGESAMDKMKRMQHGGK